jgi:hypothetical protein
LSLGAIRKLWHVKRCKTRVSHFNAIFWCSEVAKNSFAPNASILLHWTENDVWLSFRTFRKPLARKKMQTCYSDMNAISWCTEVAKMVTHETHTFYAIGPKMIFDCVLEQLENLWYVKRCKTCVSGLNALF